MPSKKSYNRFFIILQEEQKGYGIDSNKTPSGYAKLEMRNDKAKISFYIQDIKKQNGPYHMVLIAKMDNGDKELINLGQLTIGENGKADISGEYSSENVLNTGIDMDKVQGAGVCRINGTKVSPVMVGFICGEELKNWATYPVAKGINKSINASTSQGITGKNKEATNSSNDVKNIKQEKKSECKVISKEVPKCNKNNSEPRDEGISQCKTVIKNVVEDKVKDIQNFDEYENQIERLKEDRKKYSSKETSSKECKCKDKQEEYFKEKDHEHKEHHDTQPKIKHLEGPTGEFFKDIVKDLDKVGYKDQVKNCVWYKVKVDNLDCMYSMNDYNKYSVIFYPMICYYPYISKHKHFMIGYKCDDEGALKYIIYAIPGTKDLVDQPYEGKTGFVTFMDEENNNGYWMMYYDVKKNSVVVPVKKVK